MADKKTGPKYEKRFSSIAAYSFVRRAKKEPELQAQCQVPRSGKARVVGKVGKPRNGYSR